MIPVDNNILPNSGSKNELVSAYKTAIVGMKNGQSVWVANKDIKYDNLRRIVSVLSKKHNIRLRIEKGVEGCRVFKLPNKNEVTAAPVQKPKLNTNTLNWLHKAIANNVSDKEIIRIALEVFNTELTSSDIDDYRPKNPLIGLK